MIGSGQQLLIDADDTLWENNIYFEEAFERFCKLLDHSTMSPDEVRAALDDIEVENNKLHGYGAVNFVRNLRQCFETLVERDPELGHFEEISAYAFEIMNQPVRLLAGVAETLPILSQRNQCVLFTKGAHEEQLSKIERSGLMQHFQRHQIVKEKNREAYEEIVERLGFDRDRTWMVGNSPKSDINPALAAGLGAVYVPHERTWTLEREELSQSQRLVTARDFADLLRIF